MNRQQANIIPTILLKSPILTRCTVSGHQQPFSLLLILSEFFQSLDETLPAIELLDFLDFGFPLFVLVDQEMFEVLFLEFGEEGGVALLCAGVGVLLEQLLLDVLLELEEGFAVDLGDQAVQENACGDDYHDYGCFQHHSLIPTILRIPPKFHTGEQRKRRCPFNQPTDNQDKHLLLTDRKPLGAQLPQPDHQQHINRPPHKQDNQHTKRKHIRMCDVLRGIVLLGPLALPYDDTHD